MSSWVPPALTWLITGCSSGLGLALCRHIQSRATHHHLIATSRNPSRTPDLVREIESHPSGHGRWLKLDLDDRHCDSLITELEDAGTHIDVLVNAAGFALLGAGELFTEEEVRGQMETNFFGPYRLMRAVVPHMRRRRRGMIVHLSSGAGCFGRPSMSLYGASKSAMDAMMRIMAKEISTFNIRSLNVVLGAFDTSFVSNVQPTGQSLPDDYKGSALDPSLRGEFVPDGDTTKAVKAIYDVVVGEDYGEGKGDERVLYLGRDMWKAMEFVSEDLLSNMEKSKDICNNVYTER